MLKRRTWGLRGTTAAETSLVPLLLFIGAAWVAYDDSQRQAEERMARTLDLLYVNARTTLGTQSLVVSHVREIVDDYSSDEILADERRIQDRLQRHHGVIDLGARRQVQEPGVLEPVGQGATSRGTSHCTGQALDRVG